MASHPEHPEQGNGAHDHPKFLHHHFDTPQQQFDSDKLGMWLFLMTEILMFGGLFCAYSVYRANHPEIFIYAHQFLDKTLGGINTIVLILSSFTMAWAVRAAQLNQRKLLVTLLALTLLGGFGFMSIKAIEYNHKWKHGLLWGARYQSQAAHDEHAAAAEGTPAPAAGEASHGADAVPAAPAPEAAPAAAPATTPPAPAGGAPAPAAPGQLALEVSNIKPAPRGPAGLSAEAVAAAGHGTAELAAEPRNVRTFFAIYFAMTGLHALHVLGGMVVIFIMLVLAAKGRFNSEYYTPVDLTGLFWHLVDLIWIFLFPLLYLIH